VARSRDRAGNGRGPAGPALGDHLQQPCSIAAACQRATAVADGWRPSARLASVVLVGANQTRVVGGQGKQGSGNERANLLGNWHFKQAPAANGRTGVSPQNVRRLPPGHGRQDNRQVRAGVPGHCQHLDGGDRARVSSSPPLKRSGMEGDALAVGGRAAITSGRQAISAQQPRGAAECDRCGDGSAAPLRSFQARAAGSGSPPASTAGSTTTARRLVVQDEP